MVPRVSTDATLCDRLWTKLDPPSDSLSSSSSLSSSDTVIHLSVPGLAPQAPPSWSGHAHHTPLRACSSAHVTKSSSTPTANATKSSQNLQPNLLPSQNFVSKTKSSPNLQQTTVPVSSHVHVTNRQLVVSSSAQVSKSSPDLQQSVSNISKSNQTLQQSSSSFAYASKSNQGLQQDLLPSSSSPSFSKSTPSLQQSSCSTNISSLQQSSRSSTNISNQSLQPDLLTSCSSVSKSKSSPDLQSLAPPPEAPPPEAPRLAERRHTWSRLFMEGLKRSGSLAPPPGSVSKSLGDLTSDDIAPSFDSKYRSIRRSFAVRVPRGRPDRADALTAQLRRLADVEPLSPTNHAATETPEVGVDEGLARKASSRSQSRVRSINSRAKKNQERLRLLSQGSAPIEERGNPEGACSVAHSPCPGLDPLSLSPNPLALSRDSPRTLQSPDPRSDIARLLKL